ncbi:DUF4421 family protein [Flavihumibacter fluvii]|uniref:DUF4421 family protein n=1 Tax=Flavihumibacter fluvii TaxID=2838157 RepID=UPI001BDF6005|nr:DUF4421 family protein [Flavihumibacter fluvii]ULQ51056.1 DUF4421 domain-containing protein [Flavihumibacter fluvii]
MQKLMAITLFIGWTTLASLHGIAQQPADTPYFRKLALDNDIEAYMGKYNKVFSFIRVNNDNFITHHKLMANTSSYIGVHADYKWLSADLSTGLPRTFVDNAIHGRKALGIHLGKTTDKMRIDGGYERFNGLVLPLTTRPAHHDLKTGFTYTDYSLQATYIFNAGKFSLPAAMNYGAVQLRSAGTLLTNISTTVHMFTQPADSARHPSPGASHVMQALGDHPSWMNTIVHGGYAYNFIVGHGNWSINPWLMTGIGAQRELKGKAATKLVYDYRCTLTMGYNSPQVYVYLNAFYNHIESRLRYSNLIVRDNDLWLTVGYRLGTLSHKIMGLL